MNPPRQGLLIVDDEAPARDRLARIVSELGGWKCIGSCSSGSEAIDRVERDRPAVVLLDIEMPAMSGIEVARHLTRLEHPPAVVFTTAYDQYALEAFDAQAIAYLLKPVRRQRLEQALDRATRPTAAMLGRLQSEAGPREPRRFVAARERGRLKLIPVDTIRYFEAEQKYTRMHHEHGRELIDESLKQLEQEFADRFVRVHRGVLVAVAAIAALEQTESGGYCVRLRDDEARVAVSRRQLGGLRSRLADGR